jgi:hypothetical protein
MKNFLISILAIFSAGVAHAASLADTNAIQFGLNHANLSAFSRYQLGTKLIKGNEFSKKCVYDFSKQGGAISTLSLLDELGKACVLPNKAIIRDVLIDVVTAPTSGGSATIAVGSGAATNDLKAATAIASYTGLVAGIPVGTAATAIKLSADKTPSVTIATATLTAGKLNVHIKYQLSE